MAIGKYVTIATCLVIGCLALLDDAAAVPIRFEPGATTVAAGDSFLVDVVISDLGGEIVSTYDLDVLYDASILAASDVIFTPLLGNPELFEVFNDLDLSVPGTADFAQLSLLPDADLLALQAAGTFTLATIAFDAVAPGTSTLEFFLDPVNDFKGLDAAILPITTTPGTVTVEAAVAVSEPSTLWLMLIPLAVMALARRGALHLA